MSYAHGMYSINISEGSEVDKQGLVDELNLYSWDTLSATSSFLLEDGNIYANRIFEYPNISIAVTTAIEWKETEDSEPITIPINEATQEQLDDAWDNIEEEVPLSFYSKTFTKFIKSGVVTIACVSNEKGHYVNFQKLELHAGGKVVLDRHSVSCYGIRALSDSFDPATE